MGDNGLLKGEHGMVDKRTMHEPSIRIPLVVRYPGRSPKRPKVIDRQVLTIDIAPSLLELCGAEPLREDPRPVVGETGAARAIPDWRKAWFYEYNYEKQFPYTPNIRGVRTDEWKYMHYPHGDGSPDRHMAELYDLKHDPDERQNLINDPRQQQRIDRLEGELVAAHARDRPDPGQR